MPKFLIPLSTETVLALASGIGPVIIPMAWYIRAIGLILTLGLVADLLRRPNWPTWVRLFSGATLFALIAAVTLPQIVTEYVGPVGAASGAVVPSKNKDDSIPIFPAFVRASKEASAFIGEPIAPVEDSLNVYQVWLEQGNVIWLQNPGIMCGIDNGAHDGRYLCTHDAFHAGTTEPNLFNESYVRSRLKLARTDYWPRGSLAYAMIQHADQWGWLGKTFKQCRLDDHQVHFQKFTGGVIYGPFRVTPRNDLEAAFSYVLLANGRSYKVPSSATPPTNVGCDGD